MRIVKAGPGGAYLFLNHGDLTTLTEALGELYSKGIETAERLGFQGFEGEPLRQVEERVAKTEELAEQFSKLCS